MLKNYVYRLFVPLYDYVSLVDGRLLFEFTVYRYS